MASTKCAGCNQPLSGQVIEALNKKWHVEHFVCGSCRQALGSSKTFMEKDGMPFCATCHAEKYSAKCGKCKLPIVGRAITALNQSWHPEHFVCTKCDKKFDEKSSFQEKNGQPFCISCTQGGGHGAAAQGPSTCFSCKKAITDGALSALNHQWHSACFVCQDCRKPFGSSSYYEVAGQPYCEHDYHMRQGLICSSCNQIVKGQCVTALGRKYHPEHFVCSVCKKQLTTNNSFVENRGQVVCEACSGTVRR